MCGGREFQSLGAEQLNDRAPIVVSRGETWDMGSRKQIFVWYDPVLNFNIVLHQIK